ncbi:FAD binding domain-containing protein, partial [bacterium]|nr:FAD binding domain-containing protein [candidate division CSSED10-310 bacterium]
MHFPNLQIIHRPKTVSDAVHFLTAESGSTRIIAGGTSRAMAVRRDTTALVDIWTLALDSIEEAEGRIRIGAGATLAQVARHPGLN